MALMAGIIIGLIIILMAKGGDATKNNETLAATPTQTTPAPTPTPTPTPPSEIRYYETGEILSEKWHLNGELHRENDLPALIAYRENGNIETEIWFLNGQEHRENDQEPIGRLG